LLVLKSTKRSVINIQPSMLDVRCSTFNLFTVSANLIIKKPCHFGEVSHKECRQPATGNQRPAANNDKQ